MKIRRDWAVAAIILVCGYALIGFGGRLWVQWDKGIPGYGKQECIDVFFAGAAQRQQASVFDYIRDKTKGQDIHCESTSSSIPFLRSGSVKLSFTDSEVNLKKVSEIISSKFPSVEFEISKSEA